MMWFYCQKLWEGLGSSIQEQLPPPACPPSLSLFLIPVLEAKELIFCNLWLSFILMIHQFCSQRREELALRSQRCLVFRLCNGKGEALKAPFDE